MTDEFPTPEEFFSNILCEECLSKGCICQVDYFISDDMDTVLSGLKEDVYDPDMLFAAKPLEVVLPIFIPTCLSPAEPMEDEHIYSILAYLATFGPVTNRTYNLLKLLPRIMIFGCVPISKMTEFTDESEWCMTVLEGRVISAVVTTNSHVRPVLSKGFYLCELLRVNPFPGFWNRMNYHQHFSLFFDCTFVGADVGELEFERSAPEVYATECVEAYAPYAGNGHFMVENDAGFPITRRNIDCHLMETTPIVSVHEIPEVSDLIYQGLGNVFETKGDTTYCAAGYLIADGPENYFRRVDKVFAGPTEMVVFFLAISGGKVNLSFRSKTHYYHPELHVLPSWGDYTIVQVCFCSDVEGLVQICLDGVSHSQISCGISATPSDTFCPSPFLRACVTIDFDQSAFVSKYSKYLVEYMGVAPRFCPEGYFIFSPIIIPPTDLSPIPLLKRGSTHSSVKLRSSKARAEFLETGQRAYSGGPVTGECSTVCFRYREVEIVVGNPWPDSGNCFRDDLNVPSILNPNRNLPDRCLWCWGRAGKHLCGAATGIRFHQSRILGTLLGGDRKYESALNKFSAVPAVTIKSVAYGDDSLYSAEFEERNDEEEYLQRLLASGEIDQSEYWAMTDDRGQDRPFESENDDDEEGEVYQDID